MGLSQSLFNSGLLLHCIPHKGIAVPLIVTIPFQFRSIITLLSELNPARGLRVTIPFQFRSIITRTQKRTQSPLPGVRSQSLFNSGLLLHQFTIE